MHAFRRKTAARIALVSLVLAAVASPLAWFVARENAEKSVVALAIEESQRLILHFDAMADTDVGAAEHAADAANAITGGLFDIAEIYDRNGRKLAERMTVGGASIERLLPSHGRPAYNEAWYESVRLSDGHWALRVFVPLRAEAARLDQPVTGYFEGVRLVPDWQREQMLSNAMTSAAMACLAALLCGLAIYPVVVHLSADNARKAREVLDSHVSMMEALGRAIAKRDSDTGAHNYRVAWIASRIAESLGLSGREMQSLIVGSFLHDVGKIGIPDAILLKPGRLDEDEFRVMRTHVEQGEHIVSGIGWLEEAQSVVAGHHEKWDGSGYPRGLRGDAIPLPARIFAVADVFDALCSRRPYKEPLSFEDTMAIMHRDTGKHFDPAVMNAFDAMARDLYDRLAGCDEAACRELLEERVRQHFGLA
jgi:HD-GYP domain-containing protein (c-di-GMP phosphodiesterase class II)